MEGATDEGEECKGVDEGDVKLEKMGRKRGRRGNVMHDRIITCDCQ